MRGGYVDTAVDKPGTTKFLAVIIIGVTLVGAVAYEIAKRRETARERANRELARRADAGALMWRAAARSPAE